MAKNLSISADFLPQILRTAIFMITLGLVVFAFPANRPEWSCSLLKQIAANLKFCGDSFLATGIHTFIYNWLLDIYPRSFTGFLLTLVKTYASFAAAVWATKLIRTKTVLEAFDEGQLQKDVKKSKTTNLQSNTEVVFTRNYE